jgi:hypothetical protein
MEQTLAADIVELPLPKARESQLTIGLTRPSVGSLHLPTNLFVAGADPESNPYVRRCHGYFIIALLIEIFSSIWGCERISKITLRRFTIGFKPVSSPLLRKTFSTLCWNEA